MSSYLQRKFDKNDTRDTRTELFKGTLSFPVTGELDAQAGYSYLQIRDRLTNFANDTRQTSLSLKQTINFLKIAGSASPSMVYRSVGDGISNWTEFNGGLLLDLYTDRNNLTFTYNQFLNDAGANVQSDITGNSSTLEYTHTYFVHRFGLSAKKYRQSAKFGTSNNAYRIGIFWTLNLSTVPDFELKREPIDGGRCAACTLSSEYQHLQSASGN